MVIKIPSGQVGVAYGFLHPNTTTSETAPSMILGEKILITEGARWAARSEAAAAKTASAMNTALSAAKYEG